MEIKLLRLIMCLHHMELMPIQNFIKLLERLKIKNINLQLIEMDKI